ncbi:MAG TPA: hypothetical protein ENK57_15535, partial [Polyangiaceae bacterium]|nr:hypothetical protein [Polyangiaceae bacterium]
MSRFGRSSDRRRYLMQRRQLANLTAAREQSSTLDSALTAGGPAPGSSLAVRAPDRDERWVDLIHHDPIVSVDVEVLRSALRFAFESGDAGGLLGKAVDDAPVTPSRWDPSAFSLGLFLPELVSNTFTIKIGKRQYTPSESHLIRVLEHPPEDPRDIDIRQGVLRELVSAPALRESVERIYGSLRELRGLLDERPMTPGETVRRKVEVLTAVKAVLDEADEGLSGAKSALTRLHDFARDVRSRDAYARLTQVLDFDANMATLEVRVVLGSDGKIRDFRLLEANENIGNPLVLSPWRRFWSRLVAWLRGY